MLTTRYRHFGGPAAVTQMRLLRRRLPPRLILGLPCIVTVTAFILLDTINQ